MEFYVTLAGRCPVREYLDSLDGREARRVVNDLRLLAEFGLGLGLPHVRPLGQKLWELRTQGQRQHRVLYVAITGQRFLLLHAFTKKTAKTPRQEIEVALARLAEYEGRPR